MCKKGVASKVRTYGYLAINNMYNIVNLYNPVAYRLNATVDADYAASLNQHSLPIEAHYSSPTSFPPPKISPPTFSNYPTPFKRRT
jgi:hypothetical protein